MGPKGGRELRFDGVNQLVAVLNTYSIQQLNFDTMLKVVDTHTMSMQDQIKSNQMDISYDI